MDNQLLHTLYVLSGVCMYAGVHHAYVGWRHPFDRTHLLFALMCVTIALYVIAKASAYEADSAQALVHRRRWELAFAIAFFVALPWFVREYAGLRSPWMPLLLSVVMLAVLMANLLLPFGIGFARLPDFTMMTLPWNERVVDLRVPQDQRGIWFQIGWSAMLAVFGYGLHAGWRQYRRGERQRALILTGAIAVFLAFFMFNRLVNDGRIAFTHTAEFGFLALLLLMNRSLVQGERQLERRMAAVLDNTPAVVYLKDLHGRYLLVNRQFSKAFNYPDQGLRGRTDYDLFSKDQADCLRANDRKVMHERCPLNFDETVTVEGEPRHFLTCKFPVLAPDGTLVALGGSSLDVTDARRVESERDTLRTQVLHADRVARVSALSTSLAHELSQPLTAMLSNAQAGLRFLERGTDAPEEFRDILHDIVRDDERAIAIISGLRAMLRQKNNERGPIDVFEAVTEALDLLQDEILRRGVRYERDLQQSCYVLADKVQIEQVILNLVMNALDALDTNPAGQRLLRISVAADGDGQVRVAVRDTGAGLASGDAERIFESFYSTKSQGLGMGLALCRSIIESHGGRIWATNNADHGATVQFILPMIDKEKSP